MAGPLGKKVAIPDSFSPEILFPISRDDQRKDKDLIFDRGVDIWNLYEIFWLNQDNISNHNELSIHIPADSKFTVESKSLKLFVNSLIHKRFESLEEVINTIKGYLENLIETSIKIDDIYLKKELSSKKIIIHSDFNHAPKVNNHSAITRFSGFRSLCPVTAQPDVADIYIDGAINPEDTINISKYLGTFFDKECFHELCVEYIFSDLIKAGYKINSVEGYFERRGGIAIIPVRTSA
jgi:7-cyano-7-deazaguanine reductase|tara:strand:- start:63 stop:773 length:711 start_codon:yes stop_codon:yes gene_type:complete